MTQTKLAEKAGIHTTAISQAETGRLTNAMVIRDLAKALGWEFDELLEALQETREDRQRLEEEFQARMREQEEARRTQNEEAGHETAQMLLRAKIQNTARKWDHQCGPGMFRDSFAYPRGTTFAQALRLTAEQLEATRKGEQAFHVLAFCDGEDIVVDVFGMKRDSEATENGG